MTNHQGRLHYDLAQGLIGDHGDVPCYDAQVRCDHERAAVHAALAQAHALAAIAGNLEQISRQLAIFESVPVTSPAETAEVDDDPGWLDKARDLVFHGPDCPGHTTGKPGESCLEPLP